MLWLLFKPKLLHSRAPKSFSQRRKYFLLNLKYLLFIIDLSIISGARFWFRITAAELRVYESSTILGKYRLQLVLHTIYAHFKEQSQSGTQIVTKAGRERGRRPLVLSGDARAIRAEILD